MAADRAVKLRSGVFPLPAQPMQRSTFNEMPKSRSSLFFHFNVER